MPKPLVTRHVPGIDSTGEERWLIVDLDGTVSDHRWRLPLAELGKWDDFHVRSGADDPIPLGLDLVDSWACKDRRTRRVALVSGRGAIAVTETLSWLDRHGLDFSELYLRLEDDRRPSVAFKQEVIRENFLDRGRIIVGVLEDREDLRDMFLAMGLPVALVQLPTEVPNGRV